MKYNLLQLTQNILSALNSDEVNSISDTTEAMQVATIIQTVYFNMLSRYDLPENNQLCQLIGSADENQPVLMYKPEGVSRIEWIKYLDTNPINSSQESQFGSYHHGVNTDIVSSSNVDGGSWSTTSITSAAVGINAALTFVVATGLAAKPNQVVTVLPVGIIGSSMSGVVVSYVGTQLVLNITSSIGSGTYSNWTITSPTVQYGPGYQNIKILSLKGFLEMTNQFNPSESNVDQFRLQVTNQASSDPNQFTFNYRNDIQPHYCTVVSDYFLVFDSFDSTQDSTLQSSKTMCLGWILPIFRLEDTFIPQLDNNIFPLLLNEAKSLAFLELKQQPHQKAEQEIKRQISSLQKFKAVQHQPSDFEKLPNFGRRAHKWT